MLFVLIVIWLLSCGLLILVLHDELDRSILRIKNMVKNFWYWLRR